MKTTPRNKKDFEEIAKSLPDQEQAVQAAMDLKLTEYAQEKAGPAIESTVRNAIMGKVNRIVWMQVRGNEHNETVFTFDAYTDYEMQHVSLPLEQILKLM